MSFETISLLLNWMELGALLAILFRLSSTFTLIANTQRELRRAIHHLGESRAAELGINNASHVAGMASISHSPEARAGTMVPDDLAALPREASGLSVTPSSALFVGGVSLSVLALRLLALIVLLALGV